LSEKNISDVALAAWSSGIVYAQKTVAMGREIKSRQGIGRVVVFILKNFSEIHQIGTWS
jgi:hypothetical protein